MPAHPFTAFRYDSAPCIAQLGLAGVTFVVSSGDDGAHSTTDRNCLTPKSVPEWPTSSPWVVSVGATELAGGGVAKSQPTSNDCKIHGVGNFGE